jgi:putative ABC transport system permease protein
MNIRNLWRRLSGKRQSERDLTDELQSYLDEQIARRIGAGDTPEEARRRALVEFGGLDPVKEACRDVRSMRWTESLLQDIRFGLRSIRRNPALAVVALGSLAVGIGLNTMIFGFINALLLRPLPYPGLDRVVHVHSVPRNDPQRQSSMNRNECAEFPNANAIFSAFGCYTGDLSASIASGGGGAAPELLRGQWFTSGMPAALGVTPLMGRWFTEAEDREGADLVVVISYGLWQGRFGGERNVLGRALRLDGERATIIGVMPDSFEFIESSSQFWIPFRGARAGVQSPARMLGGIGRLQEGLTLEAAQSRMDGLALRLEEQYPALNKDWRFLLEPVNARTEDQSIPTAALALQGAVVFVLLIACSNVAGLLLAQGAKQQKEFAIRAALGAGRWRIVRQLLAYSLILCLLGGALGLGLGMLGGEFLRSGLPGGLPQSTYRSGLDGSTFLFTFAASVACVVMVGLVPALQIARAYPSDVLKEHTSSATAGVGRQRIRGAFVVAQIALAFVLLVGANLMFVSLWRVAGFPLGFDPENLLTLGIQLPEKELRRPAGGVLASGALGVQMDPKARSTSERIRQNLSGIPGVASATAIAVRPPLSGAIYRMPFRIDGRQFEQPQRAQLLPVMPDYFKTLQVEILHGREFSPLDTAGGLPVAVINESMARRYWPNESPLGQRVQFDTLLLPGEPPRQVVGVVADVMQYSGQQDQPQVYLPYGQLPQVYDERMSSDFGNLTYIIRTGQEAGRISPAIAQAVSDADSGQAISRVRTMWDTAFAKERRRVFAQLVATFAGIAIVLACIGLYGVMAQIVGQRTNEIGIRMALGAGAPAVRRLVLRQGSVLTLAGLVAGALLGLAVTRVLNSVLINISPRDPIIFAVSFLLLAAVALLACYLPAQRASRIDPLTALRHD